MHRYQGYSYMATDCVIIDGTIEELLVCCFDLDVSDQYRHESNIRHEFIVLAGI